MKSMKEICFLGFTISDKMMEDVIDTDPNMPIQTHHFAWSLVRSMRSVNLDVNLISALPVTTYPHNSKIFIPARTFCQEDVYGKSIPFINLVFFKHLTRFFSSLFCILKLRKNTDLILVHGVHSPFIITALLQKIFFNIKTVIILSDPPNVLTSFDTKLTKFLKIIDERIIRCLILKFDGAIILSSDLGSDFVPSKPSLLLEGIANDRIGIMNDALMCDSTGKFIIIYAGGLSEAYGVKNLVDAVVGLKRNDIELRIFGKGELESYINNKSKVSSSIRFYGFLSPCELYNHIKNSHLLINPRPTDSEFVKYSFPSKTIEYMLTGVPLLTTKLPSIPDDYSEHVFYLDSSDISDIKGGIVYVVDSLKRDKLLSKGLKARDFILENKSKIPQGAKIKKFFSML